VTEAIAPPLPPKVIEPPKVAEKPPVKAAEKPLAPVRAKPVTKPAMTPAATSPAEPPAAIATGRAAAPPATAPSDQIAMAVAPTAAPAQSQPASSRELALSAPPIIIEPKFLVEPNKNYPKLAIKMGQQGVVKLAVDIDETGKVLEASLLESSGFPLLDRQAQIDIKTAIFSPYHFNGRAVRYTARRSMNYLLK
jgi:protein TonB